MYIKKIKGGRGYNDEDYLVGNLVKGWEGGV